MAVKVWHASEAVIKLDAASSVTITTSAALDTFFSSGTAIQGIAKDISIKQSIPDVDKIDLLGTDSSGYQNAELEKKPAGLTEVTMTLVLPGDEVSAIELFGVGTAISTTHTRYSPGLVASQTIAMLLNLDDTADEVNFAGTNMKVTQYDPKVTGADGHFEVAITLKCLPRDFYGPEFKD